MIYFRNNCYLLLLEFERQNLLILIIVLIVFIYDIIKNKIVVFIYSWFYLFQDNTEISIYITWIKANFPWIWLIPLKKIYLFWLEKYVFIFSIRW